MSKKLFIAQIKLMQNKIGYILAFSVVFILCLYSTLQSAISASELSSMNAPTSAFVFILRSNANGNELLRQLYVFILIFPFCFISAKNSKLGIDNIIISKTSTRKYTYTNVLTAFVGSFMCFFVPFIIQLVINKIVFPPNLEPQLLYGYSGAELTGDNVFANTVQKGVPFISLYIKHPNLYNLLYAFIFSSFCGILAMLVQAISNFIKRFSIVLFLPIYLITFIQSRIDAAILFKGVEQERAYVNVNMTDYVLIDTFYGKSKVYFIGLVVFIISITVILTEISVRKRACANAN